MDLKEMVLSAIADVGEPAREILTDRREVEIPAAAIIEEAAPAIAEIARDGAIQSGEETTDSRVGDSAENLPPSAELMPETAFLTALRERIATLFEGFSSPNNKAPEAKIDLTLNFFEYLLSAIEARLEKLKN